MTFRLLHSTHPEFTAGRKMKKEYVYYAIIGAGGVAMAVMLLMYVVPWGRPRALTVEQCQRMLSHGTTDEERAEGAAGLGHLGDLDSVPLLLEAMGDSSVVVRGRAGVAVQTILGADFFFKAEDPLDKRRAAIERYRSLYEAYKEKMGQ